MTTASTDASADADAAARWRRDPAQHAVTMGEEIVMMGIAQGEYYALRDVAALLWEQLAEARTLDELCAAVAAEHDVTAQRCRPDVVAFLEQLRAKGLAERVA